MRQILYEGSLPLGLPNHHPRKGSFLGTKDVQKNARFSVSLQTRIIGPKAKPFMKQTTLEVSNGTSKSGKKKEQNQQL